jgi:DinB superfamily
MNIPVSILDRLNTQHLSLPTILLGLGNNHLVDHPLPGKWSIKDNIAHLARYQLVFMDRVHSILTVDEPVFDAYRAENDPEFDKWLNKNTNQLTEELNAGRNNLISMVIQLKENELRRIGVHPKFGKLTILDWTEFFLLHEAHHLFTIFRLAHDSLKS